MLQNRLKQCRTAKQLSVKELAERSGMCPETIKSIENKKVLPTLPWTTIKRLSDGLGLKPNQVFPFSE